MRLCRLYCNSMAAGRTPTARCPYCDELECALLMYERVFCRKYQPAHERTQQETLPAHAEGEDFLERARR